MGHVCLTSRQANLSLQGVNHSLTTLLRLIPSLNAVQSQWVLLFGFFFLINVFLLKLQILDTVTLSSNLGHSNSELIFWFCQ